MCCSSSWILAILKWKWNGICVIYSCELKIDNNFTFNSGTTWITQKVTPCRWRTKTRSPTSSVSSYCAVSAWIVSTAPSQTTSPRRWERSMSLLQSSIMRPSGSRAHRSLRSSSSLVRDRIPPGIWPSWQRGLDLAAISSSSCPWVRVRRWWVFCHLITMPSFFLFFLLQYNEFWFSDYYALLIIHLTLSSDVGLG